MRFDWYAATVTAPHEEVLGEACEAFELAGVEMIRPRHGYRYAAAVTRGDRRLAEVLWGGNPGCHVIGTGEDAPAVSELLRERWPVHRVTRVDVAEDYAAPGVWDELVSVVLELADRHELKVRHVGDFHRQEDGRTVYVGAPSSVGRVRVYEKGLQVGGDPDWVRVELVARPSRREARVAMAALSPPACWGVTSWCAELAEELGAEAVARFKAGTVYQPGNVERARAALLHQYGKTLTGWADEAGGWSQLGEVIGNMLANAVTRE